MNILSLFDGMSCGQQALERANIKIDNYYASEIDTYAIAVTQYNYPNTIQLGSVTDIDTEVLPEIELLIGGSPCQSFSFAGKRKGMITKDEIEILSLNQYLELKENGFECEGQSYLFWEYIRILDEVKPKYFLLENVRMLKKWENLISNILGEIVGYSIGKQSLFNHRIEPIVINSALVSAQNRVRLYWTNISNITQPKDKGIILRDIIEDGKTDKDKSYTIDANYYKGGSEENYKKKKCRQIDNLPTNRILQSEKRLQVEFRGHGYLDDRIEELEKLPALFTSQSDYFEQNNQIEDIEKTNTLTPDAYLADGKRKRDESGNAILTSMHERRWRILTPIECERLQTVKDNYTQYGDFNGEIKEVSNTQRYKMLGNGWTVDVITHILKNIKEN